MSPSKTKDYIDLANSNLSDVIIDLPDCRKSAILFFITGDSDIVPSELSVSSPDGNEVLRYFPDRTILLVSNEVGVPFYSLSEYTDSLPCDFIDHGYPGHIKEFLRLISAHQE